jgi:hypothetical protein
VDSGSQKNSKNILWIQLTQVGKMNKKLWSTPKEMYEFIARFAKDKVFCDLGSGRGHILKAMDGIAKELVGTEICKDVDRSNSEYIESWKKYNVLEQDFTVDLPEADVYYMWVGDPKKRYEAIKGKLKGKIMLIGAHKGTREVKFVQENATGITTRQISEGNGEFSIGVFMHE